MDLAERGSSTATSSTGALTATGVPSIPKEEFKNFALPLARIKKVMKSDPEVKMISAEVPVLLGKCCESKYRCLPDILDSLRFCGCLLISFNRSHPYIVFIAELTSRAWLVAQSNKRRTLQKSDVAAAIGYSDMFDFLIDIVPREEAVPPVPGLVGGTSGNGQGTVGKRKRSETEGLGIEDGETEKRRKEEEDDDPVRFV
jgi:hypothetical protein